MTKVSFLAEPMGARLKNAFNCWSPAFADRRACIRTIKASEVHAAAE